jgi:hypothetical protein
MDDVNSRDDRLSRVSRRPRRRMRRAGLSIAVIVPLALAVTSSAFAVTISSFLGTFGRASDLPYCYGSTLTVTGTGFVNDGGVTSVTIGGVPAANYSVGSDTTLYALIGQGATTGTVVVTTKAGTATAPGQEYIYPCASAPATALPTVTRAPAKARLGARIQIFGSGLIGTTSVTVGGVTATYAIPSDANMYIIIPTTAANAKSGQAKITLTNAKGTVSVPVTLLPKKT